ncbi:MAG: TonB family protein [Prevotellaceae bacterium]|jgi:TonB family protein|nr:TonB family protein [Prevotellaceae bacterium]
MQSNKTIGAVTTLLFHGLLLLFLLLYGFEIPYPPPGERGILISFGSTPTGRGHAEPTVAPPAAPRPQPQVAPQPDDETLTQDYEDAPAIKPNKPKKTGKKTRENPTTTPVSEPQPAQPVAEPKPVEPPREVNRNALFPGAGSTPTQGQGDSESAGNVGSPDGSPSSPHAVGTPYGDVNGVSLSGRSLQGDLPMPEYRTQQSGRVVVRIKVNRDGDVVEAKAQQEGSTVMDARLYEAAEKAARRAKFNASSSAAVNQWGIITYVFKLQ